MARLGAIRNIAEMRQAARRRLPRGLFEFVDRGAEDERALAGNLGSFACYHLLPRVLVDVEGRDARADFFGAPSAMPVVIAPTGLAGLCWYDGELALARAAAAANIPLTLSMGSVTAIERLGEVEGLRLWFQISPLRDAGHLDEIIGRIGNTGCELLTVTVDSVVDGNREYNHRNGFSFPFRPRLRSGFDMVSHPRWLAGVLLRYLASGGLPRHENHPSGHRDSVRVGGGNWFRSGAATWNDIGNIRKRWPGKLVVKGILRPADAMRAVESGADGIVVSNHGGRHLDAAPPPLRMLPSIRDAVGDRCTVLLDGGVRRGSDVVKAVALGASGVMIGRATLYGVSVAGEAGAGRVLELLREEIERTMAYLGCKAIAEIGAQHLIAATD